MKRTRTKEQKAPSMRWRRVRVAILAALLFTFAGLVVRRAYELQVERGDTLREMAEEQYLREIRLAPKRGTIYDRRGAELAISVDVDSLWANPRDLREAGRDPGEVAARLATLLGIDAERVAERLSSNRHFVWIKRRLTPREAALVRAMDIPGLGLSEEARRFYPNRELAAHVLGFANIDGRGIEGIELALDERLRGSTAAVPAIRDRRGAVVFSEQLLDDRASQGEDVTLTIDKAIQHVAEQELAMAVHTFEARAGSVVVMDPRTGEVLALANYPTFNPNEPGLASTEARRNRAVTDRFEPGSTIKPFTIAGALAAGSVGPRDLIDCQHGAMEIAEYTIHDSHAFDMLTPAQILAFSSNIGTAKIGATMGRAGLFRTLRRFGFGERTGIELPGETGGILRHYQRWYEMDAATISFGQGMSATTLQLATAMSAIANGGRLLRPYIVKRIASASGENVEEHTPMVRRRALNNGVARLVSDMLTAVTGPGGTGVEANIDGFLVAGKTGTAQKPDHVAGGYADDKWLASFVGYAPARDPRFVIAVVLDEPVIAYYGGEVAGPAFRRIGEAALRHLGVPREGGGEALAAQVRARRELVQAAEAAAREAGETAEPPPPILTVRAPLEGETSVPDLSGASARQALVALREAGLEAEIEGSGLVASQRPEPLAIAARGARVHLVLMTPDVEADEPTVVEDEGGSSPALPPAGPLPPEGGDDRALAAIEPRRRGVP